MRWVDWCAYILEISILHLSNQTIQLLQKFLSLFLWYLHNYCPSVSEILDWGNIVCLWSNTMGFIKIGFTNLYLWSFSQGDLLQNCSEQQSCTACHVSLFHLLVLNFGPKKLKSVIFFGTSSGIPFGPFYPKLPQFSPGVLFRDEFWKRLEP